jgi:hypothetical protein
MSGRPSLPKLKSYLVVGAVSSNSPRDIKALADVPADEFAQEFMQNLIRGELKEAVNWENDQSRWDFECALNDVLLQGFHPVFQHLQRIRAGGDQEPPLYENHRRQPYDDFTRSLWYAYKILTQRASRMAGLDIGFLYQKPSAFQQGLEMLVVDHPNLPPWFAPYLEAQREWQTKFAEFRDSLEHESKPGEEDKFLPNYQPVWAEEVFERAWKVSVDVLVIALALKLPRGLGIANLPKEFRDEEHPQRIRVIVHPEMKAKYGL